MKQNFCNAVIVIGGPGSSGSSTISKMIAQHFNLPHIYAGAIFREKAKNAGYDNLEDFLEYVTDHGFYIDNEVDEELVRLAKTGNIVIESKDFAMIAHNMELPCSVKVWLDADLDTRVKRRLDREGYKGFKRWVEKRKIKKKLSRRYEIDKKKFWDMYRTNYDEPEKYNDIVLDTSDMNAEETFNLIISMIKDGGYIN